jgi:hypothetical protein
MRRAGSWLVFAFTVMFSISTFAATWDEPFHRDMVLGADAFGLYETVDVSPFVTTFKRIRALAGADTGDAVTVDGFYGSTTPLTTLQRNGQAYDNEWTLRFRSGARYYLLLQRAKPAADEPAGAAATSSGESWRIATPTGGFAELRPDGSVIATYRHTLHQALVDMATYELTQTCVFDTLHHAKPCVAGVRAFIDEQLQLEPASLLGTPTPAESERFFKQHAALETAYLIGYSVDRTRLEAFLKAPYFHAQISAVRALARLDAPDRDTMLADFVADDTRDPLARVFAVDAIRELHAVELKDRLVALLPTASTERVSLGARITDSRIGTFFPTSVQSALTYLLAQWK